MISDTGSICIGSLRARGEMPLVGGVTVCLLLLVWNTAAQVAVLEASLLDVSRALEETIPRGQSNPQDGAAWMKRPSGGGDEDWSPLRSSKHARESSEISDASIHEQSVKNWARNHLG
jgi:hypothetical protein